MRGGENYFPVFDSCTSDLETLEANVVINITAFYTCMKAMRDGMRTLTTMGTQPAGSGTPPSNGQAAGPWHEAVRHVVYMLYLGLESARKSITHLVEFEPEQIERIIVILISELNAYPFLLQQYPETDTHHERILRRKRDYELLIPKLCKLVEASRTKEQAIEATTPEGKPHPPPLWSEAFTCP